MHQEIERLAALALSEDVGQEDLTTEATVPDDLRCDVRLVAKQDGVLSGIDLFQATLRLAGADIEDWNARFDGERFLNGEVIATFNGRARGVLTGERTALNFLQHMCGIATLTAAFVEQLDGLACRIADTRKTMPLLRRIEKQAVVDGGGVNHRYNLATGILIKENHIAAAGGIQEALLRARQSASHLMRVEIEVTSLDELQQALEGGAEVVLLDNMDLDTMSAAVAFTRANYPGVLIEASGNASLDRVRGMAETGVDLISVGALTHSATAIDLSLLIEHA
ncbi:MAG: carboxylating nicotinate-nucleotide diphosphorylase [Candidatus Hydrogenedens sp.]|nr:carboxylating nicotinate-nucleotide diphosphorylase [Candidatus Hydrogenedens sp.]